MADKTLKQNVEVDGVWFGPDFPDAKPTAEQAKRLGDHLYEDPDRDPRYGYFDPNAEPEAEKLIGEAKDAPAAQTAEAPKPDKG
jgi:hypothetical protein